jgi:hypothetical protein
MGHDGATEPANEQLPQLPPTRRGQPSGRQAPHLTHTRTCRCGPRRRVYSHASAVCASATPTATVANAAIMMEWLWSAVGWPPAPAARTGKRSHEDDVGPRAVEVRRTLCTA